MNRDRLVSTECRECGQPVYYAGTGRRPWYCSAACRQRAWALRAAAARDGREMPPRPAVVRDVIEREVEIPARSTAPVEPRTATDWARLLDSLTAQLESAPLRIVRDQLDLVELSGAARRLVRALGGSASAAPAAPEAPEDEPPTSPGAGLSRQQRRAQERALRKQRRRQ